jgi:hypothetical protein
MTPGSDDSSDPTRAVWTADEAVGTDTFDEDCSPTRVCRNAREFSFDGISADGSDLQSAWRDTLEREGKLNPSAESIRDLVLGQNATD